MSSVDFNVICSLSEREKDERLDMVHSKVKKVKKIEGEWEEKNGKREMTKLFTEIERYLYLER